MSPASKPVTRSKALHKRSLQACLIYDKECQLARAPAVWTQKASERRALRNSVNAANIRNSDVASNPTEQLSLDNQLSLPQLASSNFSIQTVGAGEPWQSWQMDSLDFASIPEPTAYDGWSSSMPAERQPRLDPMGPPCRFSFFELCSSLAVLMFRFLSYANLDIMTYAPSGQIYIEKQSVKLLFDMEAETAHLPLAQAALMLMNWVPESPTTTSPVPYRTWLSLAIHHAKLINAHRHAGICDVGTTANEPRSRTLRRLWWCCIICDRLSSLACRFRLQITPDMLDMENCVPLGFADLQSEIHQSNVFSPATKRQLISLFSKNLSLLMLLTEIISVAYPFETRLESSPDFSAQEEENIRKSCDLLEEWHDTAKAEFPPFHKPIAAEESDSANSIAVHTNPMYIYYQYVLNAMFSTGYRLISSSTSSIALCNRRVFTLISGTESPDFHLEDFQDGNRSNEIRGGIEDSVLGLSRCIGSLLGTHLTKYLPITVSGCLAVPLALYHMNTSLSSKDDVVPSHIQGWPLMSLDPTQKHLQVMADASDIFSTQYYGSQWVKEAAEHVAKLARSFNKDSSLSGQEAMKDWVDILVKHPEAYLGLVWTVDMCIRRRKLPEAQDFPLCLRSDVEKLNAAPQKTCHEMLDSQSFSGQKDIQLTQSLDYLLGIQEPMIDVLWDVVI
ncbi:hypothetical protein H9Q73_012812 [Fusarium xylarioides]|nr:hypothetical protein H9Q73_012812 [Fusarium xylarioides]